MGIGESHKDNVRPGAKNLAPERSKNAGPLKHRTVSEGCVIYVHDCDISMNVKWECQKAQRVPNFPPNLTEQTQGAEKAKFVRVTPYSADRRGARSDCACPKVRFFVSSITVCR